MEQSTITSSEFNKMGEEWTVLDTEYDNIFQDFLNNPHTKTPEEILRIKEMQTRLISIEIHLYKVAEGQIKIQS
jgi:hypothetical protein